MVPIHLLSFINLIAYYKHFTCYIGNRFIAPAHIEPYKTTQHINLPFHYSFFIYLAKSFTFKFLFAILYMCLVTWFRLFLPIPNKARNNSFETNTPYLRDQAFFLLPLDSFEVDYAFIRGFLRYKMYFILQYSGHGY